MPLLQMCSAVSLLVALAVTLHIGLGLKALCPYGWCYIHIQRYKLSSQTSFPILEPHPPLGDRLLLGHLGHALILEVIQTYSQESSVWMHRRYILSLITNEVDKANQSFLSVLSFREKRIPNGAPITTLYARCVKRCRINLVCDSEGRPRSTKLPI